MVLTLLAGVYANAYKGVPEYTDFNLFHSAVISHWQGGSLYQYFMYTPALSSVVFLGSVFPERMAANLNPPVVSFLFYPFALLDLRWGYYAFCFFQFGLCLAVLWKLLGRCFGSHPALRPAAALVLAAYFPVLSNMLLGQLGLVLFATITLGWLALEQGQLRRAGVWLGLALLLKVFVGLVFVWLALRRQWLVIFWGSLIYALGMLAALLVFGVDNHHDWLKAIHAYNAGALSWNASLQGVMERYLGAGGVVSFYNMPLLCLFIRITVWISAAAALVWMGRQSDTIGQQRGLALGLCLTLPLMLLLAPLGWIYYFPLLLLCAALLWRESQSLPAPNRLRGGMVIALLCSGMPQLLGGNDFYKPQLLKHYDMGSYITTLDGHEQRVTFGDYNWPELPEIYTLALILFIGLALRMTYRFRSTHTGA